jgi:hypothetical protein
VSTVLVLVLVTVVRTPDYAQMTQSEHRSTSYSYNVTDTVQF